jgi:protein ImuA
MVLPILATHGARAHPIQPLPGGLGLGLARARLHEFCGPARTVLGAMVMGETTGPVLWISPGWLAERIYPGGLREFADPARLILARARRPEDLLWSMEEALRSGAVPLVLCDLAALPGLTPVRRLHLAAEAGAEAAAHRGRLPPLGVVLTPGEGGAAGVESRWRLAAAPSGSSLLENRQAWRLDLLRARMSPPAGWQMWRDPEDGRIRGQAASATRA